MTRVQMDITEMLVLQLRMIVKGARVLKLLWKMEQQELEDATCQDQHQYVKIMRQSIETKQKNLQFLVPHILC